MFKEFKIQAVAFLILILLTTSVSCAAAQTQSQEMQTMPQMEKTSGTAYTDIRNSWAYVAISYVADKGFMEGTSSTAFSPDQAVTDSVFSEALSRMSGKDGSKDSNASGGSSELTREAAAEALYDYVNSIGLPEEDGSASGSDGSTAVDTVLSLGLMSKTSDGSFSPTQTMTQAEAASVIYRLSMLIDEADTGNTMLAKIAAKNASIEQYTDYKTDDYQTVKLNGYSISFSGDGASVDGSTITIKKAGAYVISGTLKNGRIVVNAGDEDKVRLIFNNAKITNSDGPAVVIKNAGNTVVSIPAGTESVLTDGSGNTYDKDASGTLFSADDLLINGSGTLTVHGNYKDGISGNDDIRITQAKLVIDTADDGIKANDSVSVNGSDITIKADGDGIKATNGSEIGKGYIAVNGGTVSVTSGTDGIQAETLLYIMGGSFKIDTTGSANDSETGDAKGLKAGRGVVVENGSFSIDSIGDAVRSGGTIRAKGGTFTIMTGDDAVHADTSLTVSGGSLDISKCYEGLEGRTIDIFGGAVDLTASDDGINAGSKLTISGGDVKVHATGDGIDVNGSVYMTGGNVLVIGPTSNGNGALDYDGVFEISGGTLLVAGSSGMAMAPSTGSTQYTIANTTGNQAAGTIVKLTDSSGKTIASFTPDKTYGHVVISSPVIKNGGTYTLYAGDAKIETFTVSSAVSGDTSNGHGMPGGGHGGGMPGGGGTPPDGGRFPGDGIPPQQQ